MTRGERSARSRFRRYLPFLALLKLLLPAAAGGAEGRKEGEPPAPANPPGNLVISRLQLRYSNDDLIGGTESIFFRRPSGLFFLQIYDREKQFETGALTERFEFYLGQPLTFEPVAERLGWIARVQQFHAKGKGYEESDLIFSGGLQLNFNDFETLKPPLKALNTTSFVQVFYKNKDDALGRLELLHYYAFDLFEKRLQVRGYNVYYYFDKGSNLLNSWADFIVPLHPHWDVYCRLNYLSNDQIRLGNEGLTKYIGIRYNF